MLTKLEEKLLKFITAYIAREGHSPTLAQMGEALKIRSRGTLHRYVQSLISKKYLARKGRGWRAVSLSRNLQKSLTVLPLQGRIQAKKPIEKIAGQDEINFSELLLGPDRFVLKVKGDSMIAAGILNDDLIIVRKAEKASDGDIVVALIDNAEVTLKRLRHHGDRIELMPDNPTLAPMIYPTRRVHIQGVVVGQVRVY
jgi:repressor LexA